MAYGHSTAECRLNELLQTVRMIPSNDKPFCKSGLDSIRGADAEQGEALFEDGGG
jgi:hypothetical protein